MNEITTQYEEGSTKSVRLHDGSYIQLHKLAKDWDPEDRQAAMMRIYQGKVSQEVLTGLLYIRLGNPDLHEILETMDIPLNELTETDLCPGSKALVDINAGLR